LPPRFPAQKHTARAPTSRANLTTAALFGPWERARAKSKDMREMKRKRKIKSKKQKKKKSKQKTRGRERENVRKGERNTKCYGVAEVSRID